LETFDEVGIPLADAVAEHLGMHVVIMAVGPVGDQKGEVQLRT
jgi:adenine/guanine phosphoribosyltransferase-like PRPP-binding protein